MIVSKAELKRANLNSYYFKKAYDNDSKVVYVNSFMPSEIFLALGLIPFNLGTIGGILAQGKASTKLINLAQQNHYSSDLCSTSRCILGAALKNALPTPDFLVITSGPCDVGSHIYHILSQLYEKKWFLLDVPLYYDDQEEAIAYLESQIKNMVTVMEEALDLKLEPEIFKTAIAYSNEAALYIQKTNEFARMVPSPLSAMETMEFVSSSHLLGSKEMTEMCKERYEEIKKQTQDKKYNGDRKPRILWHGLRPFYTDEIFEHLENNCKVEIISEMDVYGIFYCGWEFLNPDEPFRSLAKRMILLTGNYSSISQHFIRQISGKMKEYSIDGVIAYNSRGCRHMLSVNQVLRDIISSNNRPYLEIDGDYIDDRDYSFEQIKTRIDAFAELLYGRIK